MQPDFWHTRWQTGQIGFHQTDVEPDLRAHWHALDLAPASRVFVPLCGKSGDLIWLRDRGHVVVGVELSDIALQALLMEHGIAARRRAIGPFDSYEAPNLQLLRGDLYELSGESLGPVAAVYDRAALVSWSPNLRGRYVEHLSALMQPGTPILLVTLEYPPGNMSGPPFSVDADEVRRLYSPHYSIQELARRDILADEPRLRARGVTSLTDVCYRITRL